MFYLLKPENQFHNFICMLMDKLWSFSLYFIKNCYNGSTKILNAQIHLTWEAVALIHTSIQVCHCFLKQWILISAERP